MRYVEATPEEATLSNSAPALSNDERTAILNAEIAKHVRRGWTVQSATGGQAVLTKNKRIGWFWNAILVLVTAGLWLIYVIYKALNRKQNTLIINVDAYGKVTQR